MLISLAEFATKHGVAPRTVRQKAAAGGYTTAKKIGRNWVIDENEPHLDGRVKNGQYKNWRAKEPKA